MKTSLGIIEGFYGKIYTADERASLCSFAASCGYSYYIYAPKNDKELRRNWKEDFSQTKLDELSSLSDYCHSHSMQFGVGISPLEISNDVENGCKTLLKKLDVLINDVQTDIIAILFDDIKLYTDDEGVKQNHIVGQIYSHIKKYNVRLIFCPTYYSFDPILDKVFGTRPENYFKQIVANLDPAIEVFWTGNKVLSKSITGDDIQSINNLFNRPVTIWDNYPVNDGKYISKKIYTREFTNRDNLDGIAFSHAVNPMLEATLTQIALATLPMCYKGESPQSISEYRERLIRDIFKIDNDNLLPLLNKLNDCGIDELTEDEKSNLREICLQSDSTACSEIIKFLDGVYAFDPACLTS